MTRKEEIQEAIKDIHKSIDCNGLACWQCIELSIGKGISWADQNPRKGLWDADEVITWIALHAELYGGFNQGKLNSMCEDLRKAMED